MDLVPYSDRVSQNKIWFVRRDRGDCPVQDFLMGLDRRTFAATVYLLDRTELEGPPRNVEKFRHLRGDVYEFKVHRAVAVRYVAVRTHGGWVVASAQGKPKGAAPQSAVTEAQRLHDELGRSGRER
jgi:hypothetical protein